MIIKEYIMTVVHTNILYKCSLQSPLHSLLILIRIALSKLEMPMEAKF